MTELQASVPGAQHQGEDAPIAAGLRPCPFCGGAVMRRDALWPSEGDRDAIIHAEPSDCPMQVFEDGTWGGSLYGRWNGALDADTARKVAEAQTEWAKYDEAIREQAVAAERERWHKKFDKGIAQAESMQEPYDQVLVWLVAYIGAVLHNS